MTAVLRYQAALLLRSYRWLPPLLLYGALMAIGVQSGQPILDSLGYAAAAVLPTAAWLVRACAIGEPSAARAVTAAAVGPARAQLARLLSAFLAAVLLGSAGSLLVAAVADPRSADHALAVPYPPAIAAGLLTTLTCVLLGTAIGALSNPPVLNRAGWPVPVTAGAAVLVLVASGSPANAAVTSLVGGSLTGRVALPWLPLAAAAALAAGAWAANCRLAGRR